MKHTYLFLILILVFSSCEKHDISELNDEQQVSANIELVDGILSFADKDVLSNHINALKQMSDLEKEKEFSPYYEKGFKPLFPHYNENDISRLQEFATGKINRLEKRRASKKSQSRIIPTELDDDGEWVEEFDDDLISDDDYSALLNDEREIIVRDTLYKYTYAGMFSVHKDD